MAAPASRACCGSAGAAAGGAGGGIAAAGDGAAPMALPARRGRARTTASTTLPVMAWMHMRRRLLHRAGTPLAFGGPGAGREGAPVIDDLWYKNAVLYCLDVEKYVDSNGD